MVTLGSRQDTKNDITGIPADLQRWAMGETENVIHGINSLYEQNGYTLKNIFDSSRGMLGQAALSIAAHKKPIIRIMTGFYIEQAKAAETDGPSSAAQLALFFKQVGIECCVVTDRFCAKVCSSALEAVKCEDMLEVIQSDDLSTIQRTQFNWQTSGVTHVISIERPGPSWGRRHVACNMRNEPIEHCLQFDQLFYMGNDTPWVSIGIGDRGNEMGLGALPAHIIANDIPHGDQIACRTGCHFLVTSRVSNWAANGLLAGLGILGDHEWVTNAKYALSPSIMRKILRSMWQVGAVDGITFVKKPKRISVDALPMCVHVDKTNELLHILRVREQGMKSRPLPHTRREGITPRPAL